MKRKPILTRIGISAAVVLLCGILVLTAVRRLANSVYASVYFTASASVRIDLNSKNTVVSVKGVNEKGADLIKGADLKGTDLFTSLERLTDLAIEKKHVYNKGWLFVTFEGGDEEWIKKTGESVDAHLRADLKDRLTVTIEVGNRYSTTPPTTPPLPPYPTFAPPSP